MKTSMLKKAGAVALSVGLSSTALASSHREAPSITEDPAVDNTDLWAWVDPGTHANLNIVAAYNPLEEPAGGPNWHKFADAALYEVHLTRGTASLEDFVTYQFKFSTPAVTRVDPDNLTAALGGGKEFFRQLTGQEQTYTVTKVQGGTSTVLASNVPVAPPSFGPRSFVVALSQPPNTDYNNTFAATFTRTLSNGEGRVWAGPRDDGFYVDLGGIFDLANLRPEGTAQDGVSGFNCHAIVLEIPTGKLTTTGTAFTGGTTPNNDNTVGVWASASRRRVTVTRNNGKNLTYGSWVQVSRLGFPLINEAIIGVQDKDRYNRSHPRNDVANFGAYYLNPVVVRDAEAVGIYAALGVPAATVTALKSNRMDIIEVLNLTNIPVNGAHNIPLASTGDVLRVDLAIDSGFPNGRPLNSATNQETDITDVVLTVVLAGYANLASPTGLKIADGVTRNDRNYLGAFPWLALPWNSYNEGHGKTTPAP